VNDTTETTTAAQLRRAFEELIGATPEKNPGLRMALDRVIVAACDERADEMNEDVATLARHFPGLEQAMMTVWVHHIQYCGNGMPCRLCEHD